jgi:iron complex transport system substrate-binding protein
VDITPAIAQPLPTMSAATRPESTTEIVDSTTRREFLAMLAAAGLVAACGSNNDDSAPSGDARSFTDDLGRTIDVPGQPRRIVALGEFGPGEAVLALGGPLVGLTIDTDISAFNPPTAAAYDLSEIEPVGGYATINVEAIRALDPDLIIGDAIGGEYYHDVGVDLLQAIAPTVILDATLGNAEYHAKVAQLLRVDDELARQRALYDERVAEIRDELPSGLSVLLTAGVYDGNIAVYSRTNGNPLLAALLDLGVDMPAITEPPAASDIYISVSPELILENNFASDVVLVEDRGLNVYDTPLWAQLPASIAGQVHDVPTPAGTSYRTALDIVNTMAPLLTTADADVVA